VICTSSVTTYFTRRARVVATRSVPTTSCSSLRVIPPSCGVAAGSGASAGISTVGDPPAGAAVGASSRRTVSR
jgi:hypothetical protein